MIFNVLVIFPNILYCAFCIPFIELTTLAFITRYFMHLICLARSANLPTGLYILPSVISSFFTMSKAISVSTGPIFTIFSPKGRYLREFS